MTTLATVSFSLHSMSWGKGIWFRSQFLYLGEVHDFAAEYEDEVIGQTFNRTVSVDDKKTYESLQLKQHCRARLTPPQNKIPKSGVPFGELICIPRFVRNPMVCGAPIVTK